jgi:Spy/CpxP family protein refolding chaperone
MLHKAIIVAALAGAISSLAQQAIAQDSRPVHRGGWPIQNGIKHQPTRGAVGGGQEFSRGQAEETDKLYDELMSNFSATHHTGNARMR